MTKSHKIGETSEKISQIVEKCYKNSQVKNWKKSHTRKKMSETSFKKSQKVTNYCKRDANFGKMLQTCEKCDKLGKKKLYSYQKMPQTCNKISKTCKKKHTIEKLSYISAKKWRTRKKITNYCTKVKNG